MKNYTRIDYLNPSLRYKKLSPKTALFAKQERPELFPVKYEHYNPPN